MHREAGQKCAALLYVSHILILLFVYLVWSQFSIKSSIKPWNTCIPITSTIEVMFSNTFIGFSVFYLSIFTFTGLSFGDVHTAFDVSQVVSTGGCQPNAIAAIEAAFTEAMEMVGLIQNAITSMQTGTEAPAVGWMFNSLFGIQATEDLNDRGIGRPQEQIEALAKMQS